MSQELFRFRYSGQQPKNTNEYIFQGIQNMYFRPVEAAMPTEFGQHDFNCMDFALRLENNYTQMDVIDCEIITIFESNDFHWAASMSETFLNQKLWGEKQGINGDIVVWRCQDDLVKNVKRRGTIMDGKLFPQYPFGPYLFYRAFP